MKYAVIILGGAGDAPVTALEGRTPLEASHKPTMDSIAKAGRVGCVATTPEGFQIGSDVCSLALLGYDPRDSYAGRASMEAVGRGIALGPSDWAFRLSFVTIGDEDSADRDEAGLMLDHSGGALTTPESARLLADIAAAWRERDPGLAAALEPVAGVDYRALLIDRSNRSYANLRTAAPHDIAKKPWRKHAPAGEGAEVVNHLMDIAREVLADHEVNRARTAAGKRPANMLWIWGQGRLPEMKPFRERFGLSACMIAGLDLVRGLGTCAGLERIDLPGATGDQKTDYRAKGRAAVKALDRFDMVCVHLAATDEMSHRGDSAGKVAAIEAIDREIVAPVLARLQECGEDDGSARSQAEHGWRILIAADHCTSSEERLHMPDAPPFAMAGSWVRSVVELPFSEKGGAESDLLVDPGHDLMEYFLFSALKTARPSKPRARKPARA